MTASFVGASGAVVALKPKSVSRDVTDLPTLVPVASVTTTFTCDGWTVAGFGVLSPNVRSCSATCSASGDAMRRFGSGSYVSTGSVSNRIDVGSFTSTVLNARTRAFTSSRLSPGSALMYPSTLSVSSTARNGSFRLFWIASAASLRMKVCWRWMRSRSARWSYRRHSPVAGS